MSKLYRSREGEVTAIDTKTQLTTLGSQTAPGPLLVPNRASSLKQLIVTAITNISAQAECSLFIRLEGPGLVDGPEVLAVAGGGAQVATGAQTARIADVIELDVNVNPNQEILVFGEMGGEDIGAAQFGVTLVFEL